MVVTASTTSAKEGLGGGRGWWVKGARKSGGERGWRVPRQRFCSSTRETETSAVRAGERGVRVKKRERERVSPLLAKTIRGGLMKRGAR